MIDIPQIVQTEPQPIAYIHITVPREQIRQVMGPGLAELKAAVEAQGVSVTGPWFTHHLKRPGETFDFEICLPVEKAIAPAGRVMPGELAAMKVARTIYHGGYEGLGQAWGEFGAWIASNGLKPCEDLWECFAAGPESASDPAQWRTELNRPLL